MNTINEFVAKWNGRAESQGYFRRNLRTGAPEPFAEVDSNQKILPLSVAMETTEYLYRIQLFTRFTASNRDERERGERRAVQSLSRVLFGEVEARLRNIHDTVNDGDQDLALRQISSLLLSLHSR